MTAMYDLKTHKHKRFPVGERTVLWFFDEEEHDASKLLSHNLFITDADGNELWSLQDVDKADDACVLLRIEGGRMYFVTFSGFSAWVDVGTLEISDIKVQR